MASMIPVPYARQQPYRNPEYVRAMSDLMLQRGQAAQAAALLKGQNSQQLFQGLGGLAMSTFASMANSRDEQQKLRALQAERDREYALKQQEMEERRNERAEAAAERKLSRDRETRLDRNKFADEATAATQVGDLLTPEQYAEAQIPGTPSARNYRAQGYEAARLPAVPMADMAGAYASAPTPFEPMGGGGGVSEQILDPVRRTMSTDVAERPEGFIRKATQPELVQLETLRRQAEAAAQLAQDRREDNARADAAARAKAAYDAEYLRLQGRRAAAAERSATAGGAPTTAKLAVAAAAGDPAAQKALDLIQRAEGRQASLFDSIAEKWQESPLVKAVDRTVPLQAMVNTVKADPSNPVAQQALSYAFVQIEDTYQSAVREGELRNVGQIDSTLDNLYKQFKGITDKRMMVTPQTAVMIANLSEQMITALQDAKGRKAADFASRAKVAGVGDMWNAYYAATAPGASPATPAVPGGKPTSPFNDPSAQPKQRP